MNSEYMRTNDTVLVINSYGNICERTNRKNIKEILIRENRLEELDNIVKRCEKQIRSISDKQKKNKNKFIMLVLLSLVAILGISHLGFIGLSSAILGVKIASVLTSGVFLVTGYKVMSDVFCKVSNIDKMYSADIIGYKNKIDVVKKKKTLVEFELRELEKNKEIENQCDGYYVQLTDEKYLSNLYKKLETSYNVSRDRYLDDRKKPKVLKRVKNS